MTELLSTDVAIVGGGFAGAAVAYHLTHLDPGPSITVLEPRGFLGGGLAYDDQDPAHRINVPATRMSLIPQDDGHFARWLAETGAGNGDPEIVGRDGALYPQRRVFGQYVAAHLEPFVADGRAVHVKSRVVSVTKDGPSWTLATESGLRYRARVVVLATSHPAPDVPAALAALGEDPHLIRDALVPGALGVIAPDAKVVIIGTGLTMADVVASLDRQGHRGTITALSRRGLRSRGHAAQASEPYGDFTRVPSSASELLRQVRVTIREAAARGLSWHGVIDAIRAHAQTFWPKLSPENQSRIVRHLRVYWDVHRFRIAPQVEGVLDRRVVDGTLRILATSLVAARATPDTIAIDVRRRGAKAVETLDADYIVVTTGPAHSKVLSTQRYLAGLADDGHITADHLGLGIACDAGSRALASDGTAQPALFVAGPLARARFGELMGLPQVSAQALGVAEAVAQAFGEDPAAPARHLAAAK
jgi:uncharacterized NAD(P)/FAD-binding protein YdhS